MIWFSVFVRTCKDVLNSPGNYFFWNEHLNSASRLERAWLGCEDTHGLVGVLTTFRVPDSGNKGVWSLVCANAFPASTNKPGESSMSPTPSLQNVGLGDRVQHSSFCAFCMFVICWTDQPVNRYRWTLIPVPVLVGEVVHRYRLYPVKWFTGTSRWPDGTGSPVVSIDR